MQRINNDIKQNQFQKVYLLFGEERYLKKQYTDRLKKALGAESDSINVHFYEGKELNVEEIMDLAKTLPFLAEHRVIFIQNSGLFKSGGEDMAEYLKTQNETTIFVFTEAEVDKRSRLYKTVQSTGYVTEFSIQDEKTLVRWIGGTLAKEGKKVTEGTVLHILSKTGTDMENIQMELEKLLSYCLDEEIITDEAVEAICTTRITNHIFDMVAAISERNTRKALDLYYDLLALKEPPMRILYLIAKECNRLLQTKELKKRGFGNKEIGTHLGLPPFVAGKYVTQSSRFKTSQLKNAVKKCVEAEENVKTGKMNDVMSVEMLIVSVLEH